MHRLTKYQVNGDIGQTVVAIRAICSCIYIYIYIYISIYMYIYIQLNLVHSSGHRTHFDCEYLVIGHRQGNITMAINIA